MCQYNVANNPYAFDETLHLRLRISLGDKRIDISIRFRERLLKRRFSLVPIQV